MFIAPFVPSPLPVIQRMLKLADLKAGEVLFDLGAGDGRTVTMAAKNFGARAVGVELREDLAKKALSSIHDNGLADRVTIVNGDMFNVNLSSADVVFLYLTTSANEKIKPKLEAELKKGVRVVSHDYEIVGWKPVKVDNFCENPQLGYPSHTLYLYYKE
ncbi:methyltransferase domain-containing protein [Candidatus Bathyarchaeota archaeon A05DMB-2]|jgi:predicted RNA methylase|nr:methyltransferase domain-containing protein [Candidatus Bathyarchaeota archaeon A05DMB-2]